MFRGNSSAARRHSSKRRFTSLAAAIGALAVFSGALFGQTATGRISGTVLDPTGAAVPGAKIAIRSEASGAVVTAETNAAGGFSSLDLPPSYYTVEVSANGFRRHLVRGVKVDVANESAVPPITLELGQIADAVDVVADIPQVQTTNAELTSTVTMEQIDRLPFIGRDPIALIALEAGVAYAGRSPTVINGQRTSFSNVTMDGINIQDNYIRSNALNFLPNRTLIDQVGEFTITTQNGNPAVGGGSSQVNFTTRSGTNEFHGNLYWHNRNSKFSAGEWFSNKTGLGKPFLNLNQAGASLGGPIVKNKLLFYLNYEAYRQRAQALVNTAILTPDARKGIFTYRDDRNRVQKVNVLRTVGLDSDPAADQVLAAIPGPDKINNFELGDSDRDLLRNTAGYRYLAQDNGDRDAVTSRTDFIPNDRSIIGLTYQYTRDQPDRPDIGNGYHRVPVLKEFSHTQLLSAGWRWSPSPRWSNELRGGFNLAPGEFRTTENRGNPLIGGFFFTNPVVNFDPEGRFTDTFNLMDNAAYQRGNHSLKFGVWGQKVFVESFTSAGTTPGFSIGIGLDSPYALSTRYFPGGISGADFDAAQALLATRAGLIGAGSQTFNVRDRSSGFIPGEEWRRNFRLNALSFYGQDSWRVSPRLTVNLGLRWEYMGRFDERDGLLLSPVQSGGTMIDTLLSNAEIDFAGAAAGRPLYTRDLNNFAPNLGIAYDLFGDGRTAIRAGYSINYVIDEVMRAGDNATASNDGLQGFVALRNLNLRLSGPLPGFGAPEYGIPRRASDNFGIDPTSALFAIDPQLRAPYVQQWNFGIQHEVARGTVVEVRYAGNKGTKLLRGFDFNQVMIRENGFLDDFLRARSNAFLAQARDGSFDPRFNAAIPGSQPLTFFPRLRDGGALDDPTVGGLIRSGEPADLATLYILNDFVLEPGTRFRANPDSFVADLITNYSNSSYHAFQTEIRRRASSGLLFQANYSFSKVLTDSSGSGTRFDAFLDIHQPQLERARADFDVTHVFNANFVLPLPFGTGHRWGAGKYEKLLGGWNISSIIGWQSGAPLSILSGRASLNRSARSGENTATTSLTKQELDDIVGFRMTGDGPYFIAASAISPRDNSGVAPDGEPAFAGQVFFHPEPGEVGTLQRRLFSGPSAFAFDLAVGKDTKIRESQQVSFGVKIQNVLNHPAFYAGSQAIGSTQFGRIGSVLVGARVMEFHLRYSF